MEMTAKDIRRSNLLAAIQRYGSIVALAEVVELAPPYISQLKNGTRGIGHKTARNLEQALGMEEGDFDRPPVGESSGEEITRILSQISEEQAVSAISEALEELSDDGARRLAAALLARLA